MVDFSEVYSELQAKWGKIHPLAFVEAGIDLQPYYDELAELVTERVRWYDLEYVLDCMRPVR